MIETASRHLLILGSTGSIGRQALEVLPGRAGAPPRRPGGRRRRGRWCRAGARARRARRVLHDDRRPRRRPPRGRRSSRCSPAKPASASSSPGGRRARRRRRRAAHGAQRHRRRRRAAGHDGDARGRRRPWRWPTRRAWSPAGRSCSTRRAAGGSLILPVDSEHSALFQCLAAGGESRGRGRRPTRRRGAPADRLRRPLPRPHGRGPGRRHRPSRPRAPQLVHGAQDHRRLGDAHEQGPRGHRGALPVRRALRAHHRRARPAEHRCTAWCASPTAPCSRTSACPTCARPSATPWRTRSGRRCRRCGGSTCSPTGDRLRARRTRRPSAAWRSPRRPAPGGQVAEREAVAAGAGPRTVAAPIVLNAANEVAVAAFLAGRRVPRDRRGRGEVPRPGSATSRWRRSTTSTPATTRRDASRGGGASPAAALNLAVRSRRR